MVSAFFPAHGGGIEVVAGRIAELLVSNGIDVCWMAGGKAGEIPRYGSTPSPRIEHASSLDPFEARLGLPWPIWSMHSLWRLWQETRKADVVHVHDFLYMPSMAALIFAALAGKPTVLTQHIGDIPLRSALARGLLRALNRTVGRVALGLVGQVAFVGRPVMEYFEQFVNWRRTPRLIANGVDHERYRPPTEPIAESGPVRLLFVGRFVEKKGISLLRSCVDLPRTHWTFVGWGPLSPVRWKHLPANVEVKEGLRADEIVPYYQKADLLVLPSTGEGFPLVVQEALACATPVLVSREVASAFPHHDPRCVFDAELSHHDPAATLRARLQSLINDPDALASAREHALSLSSQWSWDQCVSDYLEIYDMLLHATRPLE